MPADAKPALAPPRTGDAPTPRPDASQDPPDRLAAQAAKPEKAPELETAPESASRSARRRSARWALYALLPLALIAGAYWYLTGGQVVSVDDAYVEAETVGVSTDVSGIVTEIDVVENQHVDRGQILYRLDPRRFQIALDSAKANLAQTALTIESMKEDYKQRLSDAAAQQGQVDLDQATDDRYAALARTDAMSQANYDQARFTLEIDKSRLESLRQQAVVQLAKLAAAPNIPAPQHPLYLQAKAQVDEASASA